MRNTKGTYSLAGLSIEIETEHPALHRKCAEYASSVSPDFSVRTSAVDISMERDRSRAQYARQKLPCPVFSDSYLETLAVYRAISEKLPDYDAFLFHGSALAFDGQGCVFTAPSGTGKSTHSALWRRVYGDRVIMINDDKPVIRLIDGHFEVFGTPWDGKHHLSSRTSVPLRAVCLLERAPGNSIEPVSFHNALPCLFRQIYRPSSASALDSTLRLLELLGQSVDFYTLRCNMEPEAAETARRKIFPD